MTARSEEDLNKGFAFGVQGVGFSPGRTPSAFHNSSLDHAAQAPYLVWMKAGGSGLLFTRIWIMHIVLHCLCRSLLTTLAKGFEGFQKQGGGPVPFEAHVPASEIESPYNGHLKKKGALIFTNHHLCPGRG